MKGHPRQRVQWDDHGVIRFAPNQIVRHLLDWASEHGYDLNTLSRLPFTNEDWTQFAQLIGYSVSGAGDLDYFDRDVLRRADRAARDLIAERDGQ